MKDKHELVPEDEKFSEFILPVIREMDDVFLKHEPEDLIEQLWEVLLILKKEKELPDRELTLFGIELACNRLSKLIISAEKLVHYDREMDLRVQDTYHLHLTNPARVFNRRDREKFENPSLLQEGKIHHLSYEEYLDPYLPLHEFFSFQSAPQWLATIHCWKLKSVDESGLDDKLFAKPLLCYQQLLKLIEACYLLCEIELEGNINTPIDYFFQSEYMPARALSEEILTPFESVCYFLEYVGVEAILDGISRWEKAVVTKKPWKREEALELVKLSNDVQFLMEFGFMFTCIPYLQYGWLQSDSWGLTSKLSLKPASKVLTVLTKEEIEDPLPVLRNIEISNPGLIREIFSDWIDIALSSEKSEPGAKKKFPAIKKTVETMYAINELLLDPQRRIQKFGF